MYTIMGVTGQVGAEVARHLLAANKRVRVLVRDAEKGKEWAAKGCEVSVADANNLSALTGAFTDSTGVFILLPPNFDPSDGFTESRYIIENLRSALEITKPEKIVCISTIGAQAPEFNLLNQLQILEQRLATLDLPITFLRPAWFMENSFWDIEPAKSNGVIPSFLQPLDKPVPMIATADVGRVSAELLQENWYGKRIVELESEQQVTPNDIAATLSDLLNKPVKMDVIPSESWEALFRSQGMSNPHPRIQMLHGFNKGWIRFEGIPRKGRVSLKEVLAQLVSR
ncbi:MAG TPA: NmrA family NAD(P)-binding protein [Pseudomonas sp.]|uniref:NmrA family NAD(P)-binding protein n=1 Tax=Pseudomonas sp. TaxID=306 RepID=UPI002CD83976|nr:NmrA family NAD(P)-binding protein [Pseudomonas sp.]HWH89474.1 NmrA family NAD(P)-binding protein [Pseudomonas sp.]